MSKQNNQWVYGVHAVQTLLKTAPERIQKLLVQRKNSPRLDKLVQQASKQDIKIERVDNQQLDRITTENHQGVCAETLPGQQHDENWLYTFLQDLPTNGLLLILDGVTDPHNLGACMRTADAAGVHAVIIPKDNSVGITPVVQKVACGAAESLPLVPVTNLARCMKTLQEMGYWMSGTCDKATQSLYETNFSGNIALVMGAEDKGMRRLTRENCDQLLSLPMLGIVSSLNVSVATGVCLFEIRRQLNSAS